MTTTTLWMPKCSIKNSFVFIFLCLLLSMAFKRCNWYPVRMDFTGHCLETGCHLWIIQLLSSREVYAMLRMSCIVSWESIYLAGLTVVVWNISKVVLHTWILWGSTMDVARTLSFSILSLAVWCILKCSLHLHNLSRVDFLINLLLWDSLFFKF